MAIKSEITERKRFITDFFDGMHETFFMSELEQVPSYLVMFKSSKQD